MSATDRYQGMSPAAQWAQTRIGASSSYSCSKCGKGFASPHEVYDHLDAEHGGRQEKK